MAEKIPVAVAYGNGIGPEIMDATLSILDAAGAPLAYEQVVIGEEIFKRGIATGIEPQTWDILRRTKVFLKAPITTPQGGGFKSLNVTIRNTLGMYANVRPCVSYAPFVQTKHPMMDVVIIRENEEDLYGGIEYRQTDEVEHAMKIITRPGSERIIRYAFEYARQHNRRKVTCFTKDNILKMTDGLFHRIFDEVSAEYPEIAHDHLIIDIGTARLADTPEIFSVIVTPNLYGDIISDVAAQVAGSIGLAGSANIGTQCAMFEAIHGSAPTIAGQNIANPSGLILASVMMLVHTGLTDIAATIHNAWLTTIEDGVHTFDIYREGTSRQVVGTREFAQAVVDRLGLKPEILKPVNYMARDRLVIDRSTDLEPTAPVKKELVGVDIYIDNKAITPDELAEALQRVQGNALELTMILNRGATVWPQGMPETFCTDQWRCRFMARKAAAGIGNVEIYNLLGRISGAGLDEVKTENLYDFNGVPGYSLGQIE